MFLRLENGVTVKQNVKLEIKIKQPQKRKEILVHQIHVARMLNAVLVQEIGLSVDVQKVLLVIRM